MSLSNRQRAVGAVAYGMVRGMTEGEIVDRLSDDGLLAPAPQIIRTPADLEALDPDTWLVLGDGTQITAVMLRMYIHHHGSGRFLPAVVVASGEHVRACRKALEGETT